MKKENTIKLKCLLLTLIYSVSLSCGLTTSNKEKNDKNEYGEIFYGSIQEVKNEYKNNPNYLAYVIDERDSKDPNMEIYKSHLIKDKDTMLYILNELIELEKNDPTNWNRSIESMYKEWCIHNTCYDIGFRRYSTASVDLNNDDEIDYLEGNYLTLLKKKPHSLE